MTIPPDNLGVSAKPDSRRDAAIEYLLGRINYERVPLVPYGQRQLKLDRMRQLLTRLGNPDAGLPIVHIAGTKGKGSTSAMVGSILHASGYDVGLFSSPHLQRIEERFAVNGLACSADELIGLVDQLRPAVTAMDHEAEKIGDSTLSPTYFELTTALALLYFAQRKVEIAVLEVGLGGRLDSTNVCQPAVTLITSISFDHTKQLGNTLAEIATEKAGIIKPGVPVLCGPLLDEPRRVVAEIATQHGCRLIEANQDFRHEYSAPTDASVIGSCGKLEYSAEFADPKLHLDNVPVQLLGEHQAANAALAISTCIELRRQGWSISTDAIREGLANLRLPARIELVRRNPTVVVDVAHNVASARALVDALLQSFPAKHRVLVLSTSKDKDVPGIVRVLLPHFDHVIATEYQKSPRAVPVLQLEQIIRAENDQLSLDQQFEQLDCCADPELALRSVNEIVGKKSSKETLVCVTGSFFIAAELRPTLIASASPGSTR
ncbi:MAG: folylpolyglutamate synthase/dihydrofolate synthase family protein [Planctomycetota bacterium]